MASPLNILVAEDDPNDILLLKRAFSKARVRASIQFVQDGQEAVDYLKKRLLPLLQHAYSLPALLLLDLKMPRLDGFEVLEWIKQQPELNRVLVLVFSSSPDPEDMRRAYDLGADAYASKPHDLQEFFEVVRQMEQYWLRLNATPECEFESL